MAKLKESLSCISCGLREGVESPKMEPYGNGKKGVLIIGQSPSAVDDRKGLPWQGRMGRLLKSTLHKVGLDLFEDCVSISAVNCMTPNSRLPKPFEMDCCRAVLINDTMAEMKPHVIILLGSVALQSFLAPRWPTDLGGIAKWRGFRIPDRDYKAFVIPTFHPSYITRMDSREANTIWEQDLALAVEAVDMDFPVFPEPDIKIIEDISVLNQFKDYPEIAFDYETTGLKSQASGHRIVCASVAVNEEVVFSFMMPDTKLGRKPFTDLLTNCNIGKCAHNAKFELAWTKNRLRVDVQNWQWDSMLAAHQLDNRSGVTGLKFQTYINFGIVDYASEITPYLRSTTGSNGFNTIMKLVNEVEGGKEKLLNYCALDSHYEYNLAKMQMELLDYSYLPF